MFQGCQDQNCKNFLLTIYFAACDTIDERKEQNKADEQQCDAAGITKSERVAQIVDIDEKVRV